MLLRELMQGQGLSQHEVARRCGRDVSWVSRRLQLLSGLPDAALAAVRSGKLSSLGGQPDRGAVGARQRRACRQVAGRAGRVAAVDPRIAVLVRALPAGRANARDHMVERPRLFLDALRANGERRAGERLRDGPEGECVGDLRCLEAVMARLRKRVAALRPLPPTLIGAVPRLRAAIDALINEIERDGAHDPDRDPQRGAHPAGTGAQPARDQPHAGAVAQHRAAHPA